MMIRQFLNPPNWFTSASLFCGLYAILLAGGADSDPAAFYKAGLMIFFAGIFDGLDGRVARLTGTGSAFGVQLDSLVDIISFGVAPSCLVYFWGLERYGFAGVFVAGLLMLCGAFRLARFNVTTDGKAHPYSQGLTITMGGGTVAAVVMWFAHNGAGTAPNGAVLMALVVAVSLLEVSSVPYHTNKAIRMSPKTKALVIVIAALCLAAGAIYDISNVLVAIGVAHIVSGPLLLAWGWPKRRKKRGKRGGGELPPETASSTEPGEEHGG